MKYFINGWSENKGYFLSFGFTKNEIARMEKGETISRDGNEYRIDCAENK